MIGNIMEIALWYCRLHAAI